MNRRTRFNDAKFGMFVHWGAYAVAGVEASWPVMLTPEMARRFGAAAHKAGMDEMDLPSSSITYEEYRALPEGFDPVAFDAHAWARLAKAAGQRYLILTAKHHDGFCLFDSAYTEYKTTNTPFGRDVVGELARACAEEGIEFGVYYSAPDLVHPGYRDQTKPPTENFLGEPLRAEWAGYLDYMEAQVAELCTKYGDLFAMWWDVGQNPAFDRVRFHRLVRSLQPDCLMNDRLGGLLPEGELQGELLADYFTPEQGFPRSIPRRSTLAAPLDPGMLFAVLAMDNWEEIIDGVLSAMPEAFGSGAADQSLPAADDFMPWEACMTFGGAWAYAPVLPRIKTGAEVVRDLIEIASRGGNLLLNVGPTGLGTIQDEFQDALRDAGAWLGRHGDAIYGTTFGPVQGVEGIRTTARDASVFVHLLDVPPDGLVRLPLDAPVEHASMLASSAPLEFDQRDGHVAVRLPEAGTGAGAGALDPIATVIHLSVRR